MFTVVCNFLQKMNGYYKSQLIYDYEAENKRILTIRPWQIENFFKIIGNYSFFLFNLFIKKKYAF